MDRRHNTKKAGGPSEKQLREALDVIIQSYEGVTPGKLYGKAFLCLDALIYISNNSDAIRTFSSRNNIDLKYLVDGANFVISKIHFNPENNYYTTLGLQGKASRKEIRERWKMFMLLYHPDRQEGDQEWVAERAKKVNEAYNTLKDDSKRRTYDRQLNSRILKPAGPSKTKRKKSPRAQVGKDSPHPGWISLRKYLPRALVGIYILAAFLVIGFIYHQNRSSRLEAELLSRKDMMSGSGAGEGLPVLMGDKPRSRQVNEGEKKGISVGKVPLPLNYVASPDVIRKENVTVDGRRETALISDNGTGETTEIYKRRETDDEVWLATDIKKEETEQREKAGEAGSGASRDPEETPSSIVVAPPPSSSVIETSDAKVAKKSGINRGTGKKTSNSGKKAYNIRNTGEVKGKPVKQAEAGDNRIFREKGTVSAPYGKPAAPVIANSYRETGTITEEEVRDFMSRYIKAYERNDFDTFMSLFSRSAIENGRRDYSSIRDRYRETFRFKKDSYRLRNMSIRIDGPNAFVSGIYRISFYYPAEARWVKYGGRINWRLIKEDNALKIIKMNYDN
ncbi:MAG: DnaJ domain-containing protein [Nitrospirota bacterium]|nr:DnaJ domain-containing protein [Nitrospirota bacterium]